MPSNTYCGNYPERDHSGCPSSVECFHAVIDDREEEHPSDHDLMWDKEERPVRPLLEVLAEYMVCNCGGYETGNHLPACPANIEPGAGRSTVTGEECC
jgi:hypothetical protein